jgi:ubiquinone/menaquinone biosynthesis C-methylase UbiE
MFGPAGPSLGELLLEGMSSTRGGYERLAERFDTTPFRTPDDLLAGMFARLPAAKDGLDVCCGTGAATAFLRRHCAGEVVALDFSAAMLAVAARKVQGVRWIEADARAMPADLDGRFDLVVSTGAFGHLLDSEQPAFIGGIARVLRPGGTFGFATVPRPRAWSARGWALRGFNAAMRVRNRLWKPEFVMYYLNFCWPDIEPMLIAAGFAVDVEPIALDRPTRVVVVRARKR